MIFYILGAVAALALGIYAGLGFPGVPGREDRVVPYRSERSRAQRHFTPLDLLRRKQVNSSRFMTKPGSRER